jgi:hypothetical protein
MITVIANAAVTSWLATVPQAAEIRDTDGNLVGYFKPRAEYEAEMYEKAKALFDPAETERILAAEHGKGRPLAEFWKELESRETPK